MICVAEELGRFITTDHDHEQVLHLYALLIVSLVLDLNSRLTFSQDICSRSAPLTHYSGSFERYKFVTYLLTYLHTYKADSHGMTGLSINTQQVSAEP